MIEQINQTIATMQAEGEDPDQLRLTLLSVLSSNLSTAYNKDQTLWGTYHALPGEIGLLGDLELLLTDLEKMSGEALLEICRHLINQLQSSLGRVAV